MLNRRLFLIASSALIALAAVFGLTLSTLAPAAGATTERRDPGLDYERELQNESRELFGFGRPVAKSADTTSSTVPGPEAVELARGLKATLVSDKVGENADQIALWPNDEDPTYAIYCNEIDGTAAGAPSTVQRLNLATGEVSDMVFGLAACDPALRTPWGTILVGEEAGNTGRVYEILDPLSVNNVRVTNRLTGETNDPAHVLTRAALGRVSFEGITILPNGTTYYADELRPSATKIGGGIYKFVPTTPFAGGTITSLAQSPLTAGAVHVLRLGLRNGATLIGQGSNSGAGKWFKPAAGFSVGGDLAAEANAAGGYTGFYRPERMAFDPVAAARGQFRVCWTNTGNDVNQLWGDVVCLTDAPTTDTTFLTGTAPIVQPFVIGNPSLRMPDNVQFQPKTGILYVLMDASTSAEGPFTNDDVWACLPDGADSDILSDGCVRVMTLKDGAAEFTGIKFAADGKSFLINLQHRTQDGRAVPHTTDMIRVSGLKIED